MPLRQAGRGGEGSEGEGHGPRQGRERKTRAAQRTKAQKMAGEGRVRAGGLVTADGIDSFREHVHAFGTVGR